MHGRIHKHTSNHATKNKKEKNKTHALAFLDSRDDFAGAVNGACFAPPAVAAAAVVLGCGGRRRGFLKPLALVALRAPAKQKSYTNFCDLQRGCTFTPLSCYNGQKRSATRFLEPGTFTGTRNAQA